MTNEERKVLELALEALTHIRPNALTSFYTIGDRDKAITAMKELLAQPEQKPVAWMLEGWGPDCGPYFEIYRDDEMGWRNKKEWTPLYTTPPQRTFVGLTEEDLKLLSAEWRIVYGAWMDDFARDIEAKLKEKNNA